ncbi:uncharacterized protein [Euwallacea fornicatus]|uniref:uncharacterized protein n=1 Tax=Euwallacea fornicatus TaxID=995702 RepID=UPI00338FAB9E
MPNSPEADELLCCCTCEDGTDVTKDIQKCFLYVEGTERDKTLSENDRVLTETVWYHMKPSKLCITDCRPTVTARQVQIKRIQLQGKRKLAGGEEEVRTKEKGKVGITKKKSSVRYLSDTTMASHFFP